MPLWVKGLQCYLVTEEKCVFCNQLVSGCWLLVDDISQKVGAASKHSLWFPRSLEDCCKHFCKHLPYNDWSIMKLEIENVYFQSQSSTLPACCKKCGFYFEGEWYLLLFFVWFLARSWQMFAEKSASSIKTSWLPKQWSPERFKAALYTSLQAISANNGQATSDNHLPFSWRIHIFP